MGSAGSKDQRVEASPSLTLKAGLLGGYSSLIAVNYIFGRGLYGVPTNSVISAKWPSQVTPAGYAFAIWGIVFALQGGGVLMALWPAKQGSPRARAVCAAGPSWMCIWACENAWQLVFWNMASIEKSDSVWRQLCILVPCSGFLWGGYLSSMYGLRRLASAEEEGARGVSAGAVKLATSINAGWLSAASCIGSALVVHSSLGGLDKTPQAVPLTLAAAAAVGGMAAVTSFGPGCIGLGYAGAVAWALQAVRFGNNVPGGVKAAALVGLVSVGGCCALAVVRSKGRGKVHTI